MEMLHKFMSDTASKVIITVILSVFIASCGNSPEIKSNNQPAIKTPAPTPSEREISGVFSVTGAGDNGNDPYNGVLNITNQGDAYSFRWTTTLGSHNGVGVQLGDTTAASYANPGSGAGCGVVLYKIASDGTLDGRTAMWGEFKYGTEKAVRVEGTGFVGKYNVTGTANDGKPYTGTLKISKDGGGYDLDWQTGGKATVGFGIWKGSIAAASFGGHKCSFALYDIKSNGNMEGSWGGQKSVTFGTETAKRQ